MPKLPAVGAITFEILPSHLGRVRLDRVARQLEELRRLWALRQPRTEPSSAWSADWTSGRRDIPVASIEQAASWEVALLASVRGAPVDSEAFAYPPNDPAIAAFNTSRRVREALPIQSIARGLKYSITLLMLHLGARRTTALLDDYCQEYPPDPFAATEANHFATFLPPRAILQSSRSSLFTGSIKAFEHALVRAASCSGRAGRSEMVGGSDRIVWRTRRRTRPQGSVTQLQHP